MSNSKQLFLGVLGSLIASAIWAVIGNIAKVEPLWIFGIAGFIAGCGVTYSIVTWWLEKRELEKRELERKELEKRAHCAERVQGSALGFVNFVQEAKHSIFAIGPTLNFLARNPETKKLLHKKLADTEFELWLLISSPKAVDLWELIGFNENFMADLENARREFTAWSKNYNNLTVKETFLITTTFIFVDANQKTGKLLITPLPWRVPSDDRPCFMVSKEHHPIAFNTYYNAYKGLFDSKYCKTFDMGTGVPGPG